jgi:hypothetical protein
MAFKPGMHQIIKANIDYDAIIIKMAQAKPRAGFPNMGWGKKCFIEATFKKKSTGNRTVVEIFSEVTFGQSPSDPDVGYTEDEASIFQGVCVTNYDNEKSTDEHKPSVGEVMQYRDFMDRYINDKTTCTVLSRVMDDMSDMLIISDSMLERVNLAWGNRATNSKELFTIQYQ